MYKLSIVVPVYNMASDGKLEYGINSLLNQTITDYEIIAVDDKSTDNSLEILRRFEKDNPGKFRVIESEENGRQGAARNKGILAAQGEFIGFMDADDWILPDTYECLLKKAEETGADVVGFDYCNVTEHTMVPTELVKIHVKEQCGVLDHDKRALCLLRVGAVSTKIYKREFFFEPYLFKFPEKIAYEDNATIVERAMRMKHYEHIHEVKGFYYQHAGSTTHNICKKNIDDRITAMRIMLDNAKQWNILEEYHDELEYIYANLMYSNTLFSYMQSTEIKQKISFIRDLGNDVKKAFPDFMNNQLFLEVLDDEQKKLIKLQQKSSILFYFYYKLKKFYRMKRYGKW